jgi:hypothetical protein
MIFNNVEIDASLSGMRNMSQVLDRHRFTKRVLVTSDESITTDPASVTAFDNAWFSYNFSLPHTHKLFLLLPKMTMKKMNQYVFVYCKQKRTLLV